MLRSLLPSRFRAAKLARSTTDRPTRVMFLHQSYYHFRYLAAALRRRGWEATLVSMEPHDGRWAWLYHGEDVNLYDADPERFRRNTRDCLRDALDNYDIVHFSGMGYMAFHPEDFDNGRRFDAIPWDFIDLRRQGVRVGYTISGCTDGIAQSQISAWSGACSRCIREDKPDICSNRRNLAWGHKIAMFCDLVAGEMLPGLDYMDGGNVFRDPLTIALDPDHWHPNIEVPPHYRIERKPGEIIILHSFADITGRAADGRNIKGTPAIVAAINRLRSEGAPIRLHYVSDVPSVDMRFIQVQADLIIDQLNLPRGGATAREALMLGKPVVTRRVCGELDGVASLASVEESPLIDATEATIYSVLGGLLERRDDWAEIGAKSREYALRWFAADAAAARYERVWHQIAAGQAPKDIQRCWQEPPHL